MSFVLDGSLTMAWCFADGATPFTDGLLARMRGGDAAAPAIYPDVPSTIWGAIMAAGRRYQLTSYDAAYLELAMRLGLPLATLNARLRDAATAAGVPLVE